MVWLLVKTKLEAEADNSGMTDDIQSVDEK